MSDLLSLARAVRARSQSAGGGVSVFHTHGGETVKRTRTPLPGPPETRVETIQKQGNTVPGYSTCDGDEAERAAIIEYDGGIPREWAEGLARLLLSPPPAGVLPSLWRVHINRATRFCDAWAVKAAECGWTASELFGLHPNAPLSRYDGMGAAFLGSQGEVIEVTSEAIVIGLPNAQRQRIHKTSNPQRPAWTMLPMMSVELKMAND